METIYKQSICIGFAKTLFVFILKVLFSLFLFLDIDKLYSQTAIPPIQNFDNDAISPPLNITNNCGMSSTDFLNYSDISTYIPDNNTPIKIIMVNFNIFQKDDGSGNFQDNTTDKQVLQQIVDGANVFHSNVSSPSDPISGITYISDSKIRIELNNIYFYQNTSLWNSTSVSSLKQAVINVDPTRMEQLNVYFTEGTYGSASGFAIMPSYTNLNFDMYIVMLKKYQGYTSGSPYFLGVSMLVLNHELGHVLDLCHTYCGGGCCANCNNNSEYLDDVFGPWPGNCPHTADWSSDEYASTTDGITNNLMGGNNSARHMSPKQIGRMHRALSLKTCRKYVKSCSYSTSPLVITGNEFWDFDIKLYRDIVIEPGASLTITCKVLVPVNGRIIVKRGARLIVDDGIITNGCNNNLWKHIEVWGNPSLPHPSVAQVLSGFYPSDPNHHGVVIIKNGAVIENSSNGVSLIRNEPGGIDLSYSGGIIIAINSTFRNNRKAAGFLKYDFNNISYFQNCTFETTGTLVDPSISLNPFVTLWAVQGVRFLACTLQNIAPGDYDVIERGKGIYSINASYTVTTSTFEGLFYGIDASASNPLYTVTIDGNQFIDNYRGTILNGVDYATVTSNIFRIADWSNSVPVFPNSLNYPYGLYLQGCTGYKVEENNFYYPSPYNFIMGLLIWQSGDIYNEIYNNIFENLWYSVIALDDNDGPYYGFDGLEILCNNFVNGLVDILIIDGNIANFQGKCAGIWPDAPNEPTGNLFSHTCAVGGIDDEEYSTYNTTQFIYYTHHDESSTSPPYNRTEPQCFDDFNNGGKVILNNCNIPYDSVESCPPSFFPGCNPLCLKEIIIDYEGQANELAGLIDGGNMPFLIDEINQGNPGQIHNTLLETSPYLSDSVLIAAINMQPPLPPGVMQQIIIANSPVTDEVMNALNNIFLPNGVMSQINVNQTGTSARAELELDIAYILSKREKTVNELIRLYLNDYDNIDASLDSVIVILKQEERPVGEKCKVVTAHMRKGELTEAEQEIAQLHPNGDLDNFCKVQQLLIDLRQAGETCFKMETDQNKEQDFRQIAIQIDYKACINAQALLKLVFEESFPEKIVIPDQNNNRIANAAPQENSAEKKTSELYENHTLTNFPNPFSEYTTIEAFMPDNVKNGEIVIYNLLGIVVKNYNLEKGYNVITVFRGDLQGDGIYFCAFVGNDQMLDKKKMVVIR